MIFCMPTPRFLTFHWTAFLCLNTLISLVSSSWNCLQTALLLLQGLALLSITHLIFDLFLFFIFQIPTHGCQVLYNFYPLPFRTMICDCTIFFESTLSTPHIYLAPSLLHGKPRLPFYKHHTGKNLFLYTYTSCYLSYFLLVNIEIIDVLYFHICTKISRKNMLPKLTATGFIFKK